MSFGDLASAWTAISMLLVPMGSKAFRFGARLSKLEGRADAFAGVDEEDGAHPCGSWDALELTE